MRPLKCEHGCFERLQQRHAEVRDRRRLHNDLDLDGRMNRELEKHRGRDKYDERQKHDEECSAIGDVRNVEVCLTGIAPFAESQAIADIEWPFTAVRTAGSRTNFEG